MNPNFIRHDANSPSRKRCSPQALNTRERILALLRANGEMPIVQVVLELDGHDSSMRRLIERMQSEGMIQKIEGRPARIGLLEIGISKPTVPPNVRRVELGYPDVREAKACDIGATRDELVAALFGAAPRQVAGSATCG